MKMLFAYDNTCSTLDYLQKAYAEMHDFVVFPKEKSTYDGFEIDGCQTYCSAKKRAQQDGLEIGETYPLIKAIITAIDQRKTKSEKIAIEYEPKNQLIMQEENVEFLKNNIKYLGFGEEIGEQMVSKMEAHYTEFILGTSSIYNDKRIEYDLHFSQSEQTGRYFFNRYEARLKGDDPKNDQKQLFYIQKGKGFTAKEAFNLLEGRYVHKEMLNKAGEKYQAHFRLDLGGTNEKGNHRLISYSSAYGYKLEDTLAKVPIREMQDPKIAEDIIKSLNRGNLQMVTIDTGEHLGRYYITPDPVKGLNMFDEKFKAVDPKDLGLNLRFKRNLGETEKEKAENKSEKQGKTQKQTEQAAQKQDKKQRMKVS